MKTLFELLYENQLIHWACALAGIISLVIVRVMKVKQFKWKNWYTQNLIPFIWSLFLLSLLVTFTALFNPGYSLTGAFLSGYMGAHIIFQLSKQPRKNASSGHFTHRHQNR